MSFGSQWAVYWANSVADLGASLTIFDIMRGGEAVLGEGEEAERLRGRCEAIHFQKSSSNKHLSFLSLGQKMKSEHRRRPFDACWSVSGAGYALASTIAGIRPRVVYVSGSDVLMAKGPARLINRMNLTRADKVFANGEHLAAAARQQAPNAQIQAIYRGVDVTSFPSGPKPEGPLRIVCPRVFRPIYANHTVVDALLALDGAPPCDFVFAAGGEKLDEEKARFLQRASPDLASRVQWLGGVPHERMIEVLAWSDVVVSASTTDGTPSSVLEGMACGSFPVVSDIPQNMALVTGSGVGMSFPLGDAAALSSCLRTLVDDPSLARSQSPALRSFVEKNADVRVSAQRIYDAVTEAKG